MISRISQIVAESLEIKRAYFADHSSEVAHAAAVVADAFRRGGKVLLFGNGGSAADAQHIAGEFINRFLINDRRGLPAIALSTDGGVLTCIANDSGFERVFARQIEALGNKGDICIAISTSGNSPNVIAGIDQARTAGMRVIGLLGRDGGQCAVRCDVALVVPSPDTQRIQETHNLIGHILCELVESLLFEPDPHKEEGL